MLRRCLDIFARPSVVFDDIREGRAHWWHAWIPLSVVYVVVGYLSAPIQRAVAELNPGNLSTEKLDQQLEMMDKFSIVGIVSTPVMIALLGLVFAGLTYVLVSILSTRADFKKYFAITMYAGIVASLAGVISSAVVRLRGVEQIASVADAQISLSFGILVPEAGSLVRALLGSFEVFTIWSLIVMGMGVARVFDMSRARAIAVVIPWWLVSVAMLMLGHLSGGMG